MSTKPQVIAISSTYEILNDTHKFLFHQNIDYGKIHKFYTIEYDKNTEPLDDLKSYKPIDLEATERQKTLSDFPNINDDIKLYIENFINDKNFTVFIEWAEHLVVYLISGSILIVTNKDIVYEHRDENTDYQFGDGSSEMFLLTNGDMLIVNEGDVSSSILFTINSPKVYVADFEHDEYECESDICFICNDDEVKLSMDIVDDLDMELDDNYIL